MYVYIFSFKIENKIKLFLNPAVTYIKKLYTNLTTSTKYKTIITHSYIAHVKILYNKFKMNTSIPTIKH